MQIASFIITCLSLFISLSSIIVTLYCWKNEYKRVEALRKQIDHLNLAKEGSFSQLTQLAKQINEKGENAGGSLTGNLSKDMKIAICNMCDYLYRKNQ